MKTIRQIAEEIGVSKQAVFYRIKRQPLSNALQALMSKENGILMVSFDGEKLIKQAFSDNNRETKPSKGHTSFDGEIVNLLSTAIATLKAESEMKTKQIEMKDRQLEAKDRQIEALAATIQAQAGQGNPYKPKTYFNVKKKERRNVPMSRLLANESKYAQDIHAPKYSYSYQPKFPKVK